MKILLVSPEKLIHAPFGLLSIGSVLKSNGHAVSILELPVGSDRTMRCQAVSNEIASLSPDMLGISCMSVQALMTRDLVGDVKKKYKDLVVVVGGVHPTVETGDALSWGPDIVVRGEGERTILDIVASLEGAKDLASIQGITYKKDGISYNNPDRELIPNLDELPPVQYNLLDAQRFKKRSYIIRGFWLRSVAMVTGRGCFGRCRFCASDKMSNRLLRWMSVERVIEEIEYFIKHFNIEGFYISDDAFTLNRKRIVEFCEALRQKKIRLRWACQSRVGGLSEKLLTTMKKSGLTQIEFGVESGSQRILDRLHKDIKVEHTIEEFQLCRKVGVRTLANVMIGIPGETMDDIEKTRNLIRMIKPDFTAAFFCVPFPGTALYEEAIHEGVIEAGKEIDWNVITEPMFRSEIPKEQLIDAYNSLQKDNSGFFREYLKDVRFLSDMTGLAARHPGLMAKLILLYASGDRYKAQSLFLHIFRKYHLNM